MNARGLGHLFAARPRRVSWGNPPYGYAYRAKTQTASQQVVVEEREAEVVRQMYRWLVEEHLSSYAIEKRLHEQGVPTRQGHTNGWHQSSVIKILSSPIYHGQGYYNRTGPRDARRPTRGKGMKDCRPGNLQGRAPRPPEEWIPVPVAAILDTETWERAQAQLASNRERSPRHNQRHA